MAQNPPRAMDVQDIQFKLRDKLRIFSGDEKRSNVNLLAVASSQGLLFAGNPNAAEIRVMIIKHLVSAKESGEKQKVRVIPMPGVPVVLSCSADGQMLAVNYNQNGYGFIQIYRVNSFTTPSVRSLYNVRLSSEDNVSALQILWNPVIANNFAVVMSDGSLGMYTLKEGGQIEMHTLDKAHQVKCGCWSPKGKQIVLGFPNGRLQQFKPDLTPAKTIACPENVHVTPFNTIAVHWLSTFQFAAVYAQPEGDPSLFIVNAPKGGSPSHVKYCDICYSSSGLRSHQMTFTHIHQWNLLLVVSANGVEVGLMGTGEANDTPTWVQYMLLDEARIELPLNESKDETYPVGFVFDTSSSHRLVVAGTQLPVMPMVHVLSTDGQLLIFDFLNLSPTAVDVCSPPPPIADSSGQFVPLDELYSKSEEGKGGEQQKATDMTLSISLNATTSTPKDKPSFFGGFAGIAATSSSDVMPTAQPLPTGGLFGSVANAPANMGSARAPTLQFGGSNFGNLGFGGKIPETAKAPAASISAPAPAGAGFGLQKSSTSSELKQPLYTVPPTFTPPSETMATQPKAHQPLEKVPSAAATSAAPSPADSDLSSSEVDSVVRQMIAVQINAFDLELKQLAKQSKGLLQNIGHPDEMKSCIKRLHDLHEIIDQANDRDFEMDVQNLRHALNESYAMLAECRSKLDMYNNPEIGRLATLTSFDPANRRQLVKLDGLLAVNETLINQVQQQIDLQWSTYQDLVRRSTRSKMHIPYLDGIYQRMTRLKDMLGRERYKIISIKQKLKQRGMLIKMLPQEGGDSSSSGASLKSNTKIESLVDSILTMSLSSVVDNKRSKLTEEKLQNIRRFAGQKQKITIIKPQRPDRKGLKSEVILETKLQSERKQRESATANLSKMQQAKLPVASAETAAAHTPLAKPTATKPTIPSSKAQVVFAPPSQAQSSSTPSFSFAAGSPFVKTSLGQKSDESAKPFGTSSPFAAPTAFAGFGAPASSSSSEGVLSFGPPKTTIGTSAPAPSSGPANPDTLKESHAVSNVQAPVSFTAKIVSAGGGANKPTATSAFAAPNVTVSSMTAKLSGSDSVPKDKENMKPEPAAPLTFGQAPKQPSDAPAAPLFGGFGALSGNAASAPSKPLSIFDSNAAPPFSFFGFGSSLGGSSTAAPASTTAASTTTVTSSAAPAPAFSLSDLGESARATVTVTSSTASAAVASSPAAVPIFGFGAASNETSGAASATSTQVITTPTTSTTTTPRAPPKAEATGDDANALLGELNICKPTTKEATADTSAKTSSAKANLFSGFGALTTAVASEAPSSTDSVFGFGKSTAGLGKPLAAPATFAATTTPNAAERTPTTAAAPAPATTAVSTTTTSAAASTFSFSAAAANTATSVANQPTASATSTAPAFAGLASPLTTVAPTTSTPSIFSGAASFLTPATTSFGAASTTSGTAATTTGSIFSTAAVATTATAASTTSSFFGGAMTTTPAPAAPTPASPFSSGGSIFGGIPKPDASVFGSPTAAGGGGNLFASAAPAPATAGASPFGSPAATPATTAAAAGGSIFGGASGGFGTSGSSIFGGVSPPANASPFGGVGAATPAAGGSSIFAAAAAAKPAEGGNLFGSSSQTAAAVGAQGGGGSIFGQSAFGQGGSGLFGSTVSPATPQQPATSGFGSGGSIFGGTGASSPTAASGGSIFGGVGGSAPAAGFGAATTGPFGSPSGAGSFAQGGASVAQTGFGSPQQPQSAFAKPVFGATPSFGSPPSFGQPSFGAAPSFGSPKGGFGSFAPPAGAASAFGGAPQQQSNLFETLGSSDTPLSFGSLAHGTQQPEKPKPTFGGSSFMNYRA